MLQQKELASYLERLNNDKINLQHLVDTKDHSSSKAVDHTKHKQPKINNYLLGQVNEIIKNEKKFSDYHKHLVDKGIPTLQADDNIRLMNIGTTTLYTQLHNKFIELMGKYITDPTQLQNIFTKLDGTVGMINELVHNWDLYEPQIRQYRGQYLSDIIFADKLANMLLKNVNLKYPGSFNTNSVPKEKHTNLANNIIEEQKEQLHTIIKKNEKINDDTILPLFYPVHKVDNQNKNDIIKKVHIEDKQNKNDIIKQVMDEMKDKIENNDTILLQDIYKDIEDHSSPTIEQKEFTETRAIQDCHYITEKVGKTKLECEQRFEQYTLTLKELNEYTMKVNSGFKNIADFANKIIPELMNNKHYELIDNIREYVKQIYDGDSTITKTQQDGLIKLGWYDNNLSFRDNMITAIKLLNSNEEKNINELSKFVNKDETLKEKLNNEWSAVIKPLGYKFGIPNTKTFGNLNNTLLTMQNKDLFALLYQMKTISTNMQQFINDKKQSRKEFVNKKLTSETPEEAISVDTKDELDKIVAFLADDKLYKDNVKVSALKGQVTKKDLRKQINYLYIANILNNKLKKLTNPTSTSEKLLNIFKTMFNVQLDVLNNIFTSKDFQPNLEDRKDTIGFGLNLKGTSQKLKPTEKHINEKYFIDHHKLDNNILEIRYNKNRHLTGLKSQIIGNGVKKIVKDISTSGTIDTDDYHKLQHHEKHLVRHVMNMVDKGHLLNDDDEEFNNQFQVLLGEKAAGNNSELLKQKLKQYIFHGINIGKLTKTAGYSLLFELSL